MINKEKLQLFLSTHQNVETKFRRLLMEYRIKNVSSKMPLRHLVDNICYYNRQGGDYLTGTIRLTKENKEMLVKEFCDFF